MVSPPRTSRGTERLHTAVGFGVLAAQHLAVRRRQVNRQLGQWSASVDAVADPALDQLATKLNGPPRAALDQARRRAKAARRMVLGEADPTHPRHRPSRSEARR
ncbi:MAG: hypothetical protein ACT4OS_03275 [Acidimicrobiales bacterium]